MSKRFFGLGSALALCTLVATADAAGQQPASAEATAGKPRITNGRLSSQAAGASLAQTFRSLAAAQTDIAWVGYAVPIRDRESQMCCWEGGWQRGCRLDPASGTTQASGSATRGPVKLEGNDTLIVLFRIVDKQVEKVRTFSEDCELDAGGRQVLWIEGVRPVESIAMLESMVGTATTGKSRIANNVIAAISQHADPAAAPTLIRLARQHASTAVRSDALFWVAQLAGAKAVGAISEAIENDPDTDVKKRAVFALSQLPKDEGVPLLIDVAKKNRNPAVRKQAMFWLGQSKDPRALEFFAEILR